MRTVSLRRTVVILLGISLLYALAFVNPISHTILDVVNRIAGDPSLVLPLLFAAVGIFVGHVLRSIRARVLFSRTVSTGTAQQLGAFCVGTFCNSILPLRVGELVRSDTLAQSTKTSFSFSLVLVVFERTVDALVLCLCLALFQLFSPALTAVAVLLGAIVVCLWQSPLWLKRVASQLARFLEYERGTRFLFRMWSVEYGLRRTLVSRVMLPYMAITAINWTVYIFSLTPFLSHALGVNMFDAVASSVATFVALGSSVTPAALGSFTPMLASLGMSDSTAYIMAWCVAIVPASGVGLVWALAGLSGVPLLRPARERAAVAPANKLTREMDPSASQAAFLRDYYAGLPLAAEISRDDMEGTASMGRYFTGGGSAAVTYLSERDGTLWVTKRVDLEKSQSLREQHEWLANHACANVAIAGEERENGSTYSMDVGYDHDSVDGFDWVHQCSVEQARAFFDEVAATLSKRVWKIDEGLEEVSVAEGRARVANYIDTHVRKCMDLAVASLSIIGTAMEPETLVINGVERPNLSQLLDELEGCDAAMRDLASFHLSPSIHGDPIVDNLLWSRGGAHPVIIDPVPCGNVFDGPVFDFGKWSQSLQIGYEFALRDTSEVCLRTDGMGIQRVIEYADMRSERYAELWVYVRDVLAPRYLTPAERNTMLFIGATNYFRRMKHQVLQCPANALKFYALGVAHLDEWMEAYR